MSLSHAHLDHISGLILNAPDDSPKPILGLDATIDTLRDHVFNWRVWPNFGNEDPSAAAAAIRLSGAERSSFSFLDRVQMCVKPMAQPILGRSRQLQDAMRKTERLKDCKEAPLRPR